SGLSVVTGLTFGEIAEKRKTRKLALGIMRECFAVARAAGIKLESMQGHDMEKLLGKKDFSARRPRCLSFRLP
ncbi:MAG: ketopantoate reductase family protein, partial [Christensenellaceae bacterium]